jgi:hypothetical protein
LQERGNRVTETREVGSPLIPVCVKMRETVLDPNSGMTGAEMEMDVIESKYFKFIKK